MPKTNTTPGVLDFPSEGLAFSKAKTGGNELSRPFVMNFRTEFTTTGGSSTTWRARSPLVLSFCSSHPDLLLYRRLGLGLGFARFWYLTAMAGRRLQRTMHSSTFGWLRSVMWVHYPHGCSPSCSPPLYATRYEEDRVAAKPRISRQCTVKCSCFCSSNLA